MFHCDAFSALNCWNCNTSVERNWKENRVQLYRLSNAISIWRKIFVTPFENRANKKGNTPRTGDAANGNQTQKTTTFKNIVKATHINGQRHSVLNGHMLMHEMQETDESNRHHQLQFCFGCAHFSPFPMYVSPPLNVCVPTPIAVLFSTLADMLCLGWSPVFSRLNRDVYF